ncbi:MAG: peptidylprolyl isomerase [Pseudomonadota bacterium]
MTNEATKSAAIVEVQTNHGNFKIELFRDKAPVSVRNFLDYVDANFYAGTIFHRVVNGFVVQGGGFDTLRTQKDTREPIVNEADNGLKNETRTVAMARTADPHSATSQFYINTARHEMLDHRGKDPNRWGYAVFGRVSDGWEVVKKIESVPVKIDYYGDPKRRMSNTPIEAVEIKSVRRVN